MYRASRRLKPVTVWALLALACCAVFGAVAADAQTAIGVVVPANAEAVDTGIDVLPGDEVLLRASGRWTNGGGSPQYVEAGGFGPGAFPSARFPTLPLAALAGFVGIDVIPVSVPMRLSSRGRLQLAMNDVAGTYGDNAGVLKVAVAFYAGVAPMPGLVGKSVGAAREELAAFGFEPEVVAQPSTAYPAGMVSVQAPEPGTDLHGVPVVRLTVSTGPPPPPPASGGPSMEVQPPVWIPPATTPVPDIVGWSALEGEQRLRGVGLTAIPAGGRLSRYPSGQVLQTEPVAGTPVVRGSKVEYWFASGENLVPSVEGSPVADADAEMQAAGFANLSHRATWSARPAGEVVRQSHRPGRPASLQAGIVLQVSRGWAGPAGIAALILGALATASTVWWRRRRIGATRKLVQVSADVEDETELREMESKGFSAPPVAIEVALEDGETAIDGNVPIISHKVTHE